MTFEGDDSVEIPSAMYDSDSDRDAVLAPVFTGVRIEAELVRSLLESNGIPAVVFGSGGYAYGADNIGTEDRVMVRSDHVAEALQAISEADIEGEMVVPTEDDYEVMVDEDYDDESEEPGYEDPAAVEVLAQGSDWGPRLVGIVGVAALVVAAIVILRAAT